MKEIYSEVTKVNLEKFRMARYVIISPQPENDVNHYMEEWGKNSGLFDYQGYKPKLIGWDFPFVSEEQQNKFGLRGYVAAYVIPEDFEPSCPGVEFAYQEAGSYVKITIEKPFENAFERIPGGYQKIFAYIKENHLEIPQDGVRSCFEEPYEKDGISYMDVYMPINA